MLSCPLYLVGLRHLDSVRSPLHLCLQTSFLLTFLSQPPLQLLLLLPHALNASLQLQHTTFALGRKVSEASGISLTLIENLKQKPNKFSFSERYEKDDLMRNTTI